MASPLLSLSGSSGDGLDSGPLPGIAGLPYVQKSAETPDEAARSFLARRRLLLSAGFVLLCALLVFNIFALSPFADRAATQPPRQISAVPLADVQPYGVNVFLHKEVDQWKKEKTLDMATDMGATWIKQQFPWAEIEFGKDYYYDAKNNQSSWQKFDAIVALAQARGLHIIARIDSTPEWARLDDSMPAAEKAATIAKANANNPNNFAKFPPSDGHLQDFANFITTFVTRYKGQIAALQIWNEPNLNAEWPTGVNAANYVNLLKLPILPPSQPTRI